MNRLVFAGLVAAVLAGCATSRNLRFEGGEPDYATLIAHRGESFDAPENTLPAYRTAVERGFGFECDVYLSSDGRVFTFHDGNLSRTSDGKMTNGCTQASWEKEVSTLDVGGWGKWKGSKFEGTRPALLDEVCGLARDGRWIYCEVKGHDAEYAKRVVAAIVEVLGRQTVATPANFLFIAFGEDVCAELKRQLPEYRVYWLTNPHHYDSSVTPRKLLGSKSAGEIIEVLKKTGADGVDIGYSEETFTPAFARAIHEAGYGVHVWTIDDPKRAREAFSRGAETVTTNRAKFLLTSLRPER